MSTALIRTLIGLEAVSPAPRDVWAQVARADAEGLETQSPAWMDALCSHGSYQDISRYYPNIHGKRVILPLARRKFLPDALAFLGSPPLGWGFGGLLSDQPLEMDDIALVLTDVMQQPHLGLRVRPNPMHGAMWDEASAPFRPLRKPSACHVLNLDGGFDTVWEKRFEGSARCGVRKAEKAGVEVESNTTGRLIPEFYGLLQQSVVRWAYQLHEPLALARFRARTRDPLWKFRAIAQHLGDSCRVWIARVHGEAAAGFIVLQGRNAHYSWGAMNKELTAPVNANFLLHRLAIEAACDAGCRYYHMGETKPDSSLAQFKEHFGARVYTYSDLRFERIPVTKADLAARQIVKRLIGFQEPR